MFFSLSGLLSVRGALGAASLPIALTACAASQRTAPRDATSENADSGALAPPTSSVAASPTGSTLPSSAARASAAPDSASGVAARLPPPEVVLDPRMPRRSLPELKVENIGLHVGGGPNDADTKAPFLSAVAARFPAFMACYRKNEEPAAGGRFGVDLHIGRAGGHPRLEQPRTALRGAEFRACLTQVFESVDFQKPKRGPTTISYSLRFLLVDAP